MRRDEAGEAAAQNDNRPRWVLPTRARQLLYGKTVDFLNFLKFFRSGCDFENGGLLEEWDATLTGETMHCLVETLNCPETNLRLSYQLPMMDKKGDEFVRKRGGHAARGAGLIQGTKLPEGLTNTNRIEDDECFLERKEQDLICFLEGEIEEEELAAERKRLRGNSLESVKSTRSKSSGRRRAASLNSLTDDDDDDIYSDDEESDDEEEEDEDEESEDEGEDDDLFEENTPLLGGGGKKAAMKKLKAMKSTLSTISGISNVVTEKISSKTSTASKKIGGKYGTGLSLHLQLTQHDYPRANSFQYNNAEFRTTFAQKLDSIWLEKIERDCRDKLDKTKKSNEYVEPYNAICDVDQSKVSSSGSSGTMSVMNTPVVGGGKRKYDEDDLNSDAPAAKRQRIVGSKESSSHSDSKERIFGLQIVHKTRLDVLAEKLLQIVNQKEVITDWCEIDEKIFDLEKLRLIVLFSSATLTQYERLIIVPAHVAEAYCRRRTFMIDREAPGYQSTLGEKGEKSLSNGGKAQIVGEELLEQISGTGGGGT